jgi:hypothetical protein
MHTATTSVKKEEKCCKFYTLRSITSYFILASPHVQLNKENFCQQLKEAWKYKIDNKRRTNFNSVGGWDSEG